MKQPLFKRNGMFFIPVSIFGWILLLCGLAFEVYFAIDLNTRSHSVSDFFINLIFMLLIIGAVYSLIAYLLMRFPKNTDR